MYLAAIWDLRYSLPGEKCSSQASHVAVSLLETAGD